MIIRMPLNPSELLQFRITDIVNAEPNLTAKELFADTNPESKLVFARYKHELDHLTRLLTTSVGLFAHQLDSQLPDQFRWIVEETEPSFFAERKPLISAHDLSDEELASDRSPRHAAVRLWYRTQSLRNGLFDPFESDSHYIAALTMLNWFREGNTEVEIEASWPPTPAFEDDRFPKTITGRNILEFFAVLKEMDYSALIADPNNPWQDLMINEDYNAIIKLWSLSFPNESLWDVSHEGRLERDLGLFARRAYPMELFASLDIALWPPLVPTGVMLGTRRWSWKDIDPGHRFVTICKWLQQNKVPMNRIGGEERNERFRQFQMEVCDALGWPTPEQLVPVWLDDNDKKLKGEPRETCRLMSISFESEDHSRLAMVDKLLKKRLEFPCDFVLGNFTEPQLGVSQLGWVSRNDSGLFRIRDLENGNWNISPSILRTVMMICRYLLLGERHCGDNPQSFEEQLVAVSLSVVCNLLPSSNSRFSNWTRQHLKIA